MYCKFCGRQIDDDSTFCVHCGKNVTTSIKISEIKENVENAENAEIEPLENKPKETEKKESAGCIWVTMAILATLYIVTVIFTVPGILKRDLKSSDYTYTTSQGLTTYSITITPNRYINNCDIQLILYDSKGNSIFSDTISKTELKKDKPYTYVFDFGVINSLSGTKVKWNVTGKCR